MYVLKITYFAFWISKTFKKKKSKLREVGKYQLNVGIYKEFICQVLYLQKMLRKVVSN